MFIPIWCNDIGPKHLAIIEKLVEEEKRSLLTTVCGAFPEKVEFPDNYFSAILVSRVLHLFSGDMIELSFKKMYRWLKPGGKIFVVVDTPYLKNFEKFIPEYENRIQRGEKWPGLISDVSRYVDKARVDMPLLVHFFGKQVMERVLKENNFEIEKIEFMDRQDYPEDRRYDGRESIGVVAGKKGF